MIKEDEIIVTEIKLEIIMGILMVITIHHRRQLEEKNEKHPTRSKKEDF
jgi:hypothetical protein